MDSCIPAVTDIPGNITPPASLRLVLTSDRSPEIGRLVRSRFREVHGARVEQLLPQQLALYHHRDLVAAIGLRPAGSSPLFLEHYLDVPIEQLLSDRLAGQVAREQLVEVGNLVAASGWGRMAILSTTAYLARQSYRYVVFTATRTLRRGFRRLGLQPQALVVAHAALVPRPEHWGRYYGQHPVVMWGAIHAGWEHLSRRADLARALSDIAMPENINNRMQLHEPAR